VGGVSGSTRFTLCLLSPSGKGGAKAEPGRKQACTAWAGEGFTGGTSVTRVEGGANWILRGFRALTFVGSKGLSYKLAVAVPEAKLTLVRIFPGMKYQPSKGGGRVSEGTRAKSGTEFSLGPKKVSLVGTSGERGPGKYQCLTGAHHCLPVNSLLG